MTGLLPDVRGMHEPSVDIADIPQVFSLAEEGGILQQHGVVELANSIGPNGRTMLEDPLRMGVFVVPIILLFRKIFIAIISIRVMGRIICFTVRIIWSRWRLRSPLSKLYSTGKPLVRHCLSLLQR